MSGILLTPNSSPKAPNPSGGAGQGGASGVQVQCPQCRTPFTAPIINVLDVGRFPQLKAALLSGQLNRAECPACGAVALLDVPLIYHDPNKELLLVLVPSQLNLPADQQQRIIGSLVQAVMRSVPQEQRKGYFLNPQTILSRQRLAEVILEADGITREMMDEENRRLQLLEDMVRAVNDPVALQRLIEENWERLDYTFLATLVSAAQESEMAGDTQGSQLLLQLRDALLREPDLAARIPQPLPPETTVVEAIDKLLPMLSDEEAFAAMVVLNRQFFQYSFFQELTDQLDQARARGDSERAGQLETLRSRLLAVIEQQDKAIQAAQQEDLRLIEELLGAPDQALAIRQRLNRIDNMFLNTLQAALQAARREGNIERSGKLDQLRSNILAGLAAAMPPELRLVNNLLGTEKPADRQAILAANAPLLNDQLVALISDLREELQEQGQGEAYKRLETILAEVQAAQAHASGQSLEPGFTEV